MVRTFCLAPAILPATLATAAAQASGPVPTRRNTDPEPPAHQSDAGSIRGSQEAGPQAPRSQSPGQSANGGGGLATFPHGPESSPSSGKAVPGAATGGQGGGAH